jgi:ligand-binding sensor domain-containing protein/two-component sensor histidine kinase
MKKTLSLAGFLLFAVNALFSQQGFTFNRIGTDDGIGLASNVVYCTYQDAKGFIWVGTANGLQRFDGSKFIQLSSGKSDRSLLVSNLTQIIPIDSTSIWLSFPYRQEFGIFNTTTFKYTRVPVETPKILISKSEFKLWKDSYGEVFLSVFSYGMLHYDKKKNKFVDDNYFKFPKGWSSTQSFFEDTIKHQYWFPCVNNGLAVFDKKSGEFFTSQHNPQNIPLLNIAKIKPTTTDVYIDRNRRFWIFNWPNGVHYKRCFDSTGKELHDTVGLNTNPDYSEMRNFYETKKGLLWMYGTNALFNYDRNEHRFFLYDHAAGSSTGIQFQYVYQVMEDHDGSIWVSTDNGLYFTSPGSGTYGVVDMLFDTKKGGLEFTDILELKNRGGYWVSTWGRGIYTLDKNMVRHENAVYNNMPPMSEEKRIQYRQTWALYQHTDGKVWIGCQAGNYMVYDTATKKTKFLYAPESGGWTFRYITGDKKGNIWLGTFGGGVLKYDGKKMSIVQKLGSNITKILVDNEGLLWLACENNGLFCLSADGKDILRHYTSDSKENRLFINTGKDIEQLDDSTIVFGAGAMNFINKKTGNVHWLTFDEGLPSNTIQRIRVDASGYLWMITLNGLCRYNPVTKRITAYGRKDGITLAHLTNEADYFCSDGFVMFAGGNALMFFKPGVFENKQPPDVMITDFKLFNNYVSVDSLLSLPKVQLTSGQNSFSIYFAALSYLQREKLTYYYKMTGIDKDWIKGDRQNFINYSLLPPGTYTFSVYCEDIDGTRSKNITELTIHIKPPFWRTYTFMIICIVLIGLCVYMIDRLRINRLLAVEKLRIRVARDLHDDMGSTLSTINILSSMAKSKINIDPIRTTEYLGKISDNSQRMMDAMDDIVWSIKPSNDSMQKIAARMREFAINVLEAKEIEMDFRIDDAVFDVKLDMEARRDFFLVFKEAINNAAKYSKASMVTIQLGLHTKRLVLVVADDGIGFDPFESDNGNGLGNMQKRADAMHARLQITSAPGNGTQVTLNVPVG